jgi:hypothetical protein
VVIIGGGMGGTTAAKFLRLWGGTGLKITLVERNAQYTSNIMSNGVLTGQETLPDLRYGYGALKNVYGVNVLTDSASAIHPDTRKVDLVRARPTYDRLVVAPGLFYLPGPSGAYNTLFPTHGRIRPLAALATEGDAAWYRHDDPACANMPARPMSGPVRRRLGSQPGSGRRLTPTPRFWRSWSISAKPSTPRMRT